MNMKKSVGQIPAEHLTILHRPFNDIDWLAEALNAGSYWQLQFTQLKLQPFQCDLLFVEFDDAQFFF